MAIDSAISPDRDPAPIAVVEPLESPLIISFLSGAVIRHRVSASDLSPSSDSAPRQHDNDTRQQHLYTMLVRQSMRL